MAGYTSLQSFQQWYYPRATFYSARNSPFITDEWLSFLAAHNNTRYDKLSSIDIRGCNRITIGGIAQFVEAMDWRLERLAMSHFHESEIQGTYALRKLEALLGSAPCLKSLTLELNRAWAEEMLMECLKTSTSLRELSLVFESRAFLPSSLCNLETLRLEFVDDYAEFYWAQFKLFEYPRLNRLEITVSSYQCAPLRLKIAFLIEAIEQNLSGLEVLVIRRRNRQHSMDKSSTKRNEPSLYALKDEDYRSITVEEEEWRQLRAFCRSRNIKCECPK
jgi:hypothetical protein